MCSVVVESTRNEATASDAAGLTDESSPFHCCRWCEHFEPTRYKDEGRCRRQIRRRYVGLKKVDQLPIVAADYCCDQFLELLSDEDEFRPKLAPSRIHCKLDTDQAIVLDVIRKEGEIANSRLGGHMRGIIGMQRPVLNKIIGYLTGLGLIEEYRDYDRPGIPPIMLRAVPWPEQKLEQQKTK